jgi:hypothetical protein
MWECADGERVTAAVRQAQRKQFFFEKKNQKTFVRSGKGALISAALERDRFNFTGFADQGLCPRTPMACRRLR